MKITDFAGTTPAYRPEEFLAGELEGWRILERVTGGLQQRFTVRPLAITTETHWRSPKPGPSMTVMSTP